MRKEAAVRTFAYTAHYDSQIFDAFNKELSPNAQQPPSVLSLKTGQTLRYGENPHQNASYHASLGGNKTGIKQLQGGALSYNNFLDIDAACHLLAATERAPSSSKNQEISFVIIKHGNPCGLSLADKPWDAYVQALAGDERSAYGGVFATNAPLEASVAEALSTRFFEIVLAPSFSPQAKQIMAKYPRRRLLAYDDLAIATPSYRSVLDGLLVQDTDLPSRHTDTWRCVTAKQPSPREMHDLGLAYVVAACARSNTVALVNQGQLVGCGAGQTSRIDALGIALDKAHKASLGVQGAVMASEAFFPFADCVAMAHEAGVGAIVQPGGSKNDQESIRYCDKQGISMLFSDQRHFRH